MRFSRNPHVPDRADQYDTPQDEAGDDKSFVDLFSDRGGHGMFSMPPCPWMSMIFIGSSLTGQRGPTSSVSKKDIAVFYARFKAWSKSSMSSSTASIPTETRIKLSVIPSVCLS